MRICSLKALLYKAISRATCCPFTRQGSGNVEKCAPAFRGALQKVEPTCPSLYDWGYGSKKMRVVFILGWVTIFYATKLRDQMQEKLVSVTAR